MWKSPLRQLAARLRLAEVLPSAWLEFEADLGVIAAEEQHRRQVLAGLFDVADVADRNAGDFRGNAAVGRRREEQLIFVAAVQRVVERDLVATKAGQRDGFGLDFGPHAALLADVREIGGEPVADVDHRRGDGFFAQVARHGELRHREEVRAAVGSAVTAFRLLHHALEHRDRSAELAGDVEIVAGASAGAEDGFAVGNGADDRDVGEDTSRRLRDVAAGESHAVAFRECKKAVEEAVHPALR